MLRLYRFLLAMMKSILILLLYLFLEAEGCLSSSGSTVGCPDRSSCQVVQKINCGCILDMFADVAANVGTSNVTDTCYQYCFDQWTTQNNVELSKIFCRCSGNESGECQCVYRDHCTPEICGRNGYWDADECRCRPR